MEIIRFSYEGDLYENEILINTNNNYTENEIVKLAIKEIGGNKNFNMFNLISNNDIIIRGNSNEIFEYTDGNWKLEFNIQEKLAQELKDKELNKLQTWETVINDSDIDTLQKMMLVHTNKIDEINITGIALISNNLPIIRLLTDFNIVDCYMKTLLHYTINYDIIKYLLENGADMYIKDINGYIPIFNYAVSYPHKLDAIILLYINNNFFLDTVDDDGKGLLHHFNKYESIVKLLILHGMNVNAKDNKGQTPLHTIGHGYFAAKALVQNGANINARDKDGNTVLHLGECLPNLIELLIRNGININARNKEGKTALYYTNGLIEYDILQRYGAIC